MIDPAALKAEKKAFGKAHSVEAAALLLEFVERTSMVNGLSSGRESNFQRGRTSNENSAVFDAWQPNLLSLISE